MPAANTEGETRSFQPALFIVILCVLRWCCCLSLLCVVLVKCLFVVVVAVFICYAVWVFRSSLGRLSTSPFCFMSLHRSSVNRGHHLEC